MTKDEFKQWVDAISIACKLTAHRTVEGIEQTYTLSGLATAMSQHDKELAKKIAAWNVALDDISNHIASKNEQK